MAPIPRLAHRAGPAILSYGFRPFFLLGALYAAVAMIAWLPMAQGAFHVPTAFAPRDWHVHEMLFGYLPAVVTGFLLTAVPNWTGRMPLQGRPLLALVIAWLAGRVAICLSAWIGWLPAALVDLSFLALVIAAMAREIVAGRNWRNLRILVVTGILLAGNAVFHIEAHAAGGADYGTRIGIGAVLALVMLIGGRIVPSFTRNWLARENPGRLPAPFGMFDAIAIAVSVAALLGWILAPSNAATGTALIGAGVLQAVRLVRWAGDRTWRDRLVLVLHVAYAFVPLGFVLVGLSALDFGPAPAVGIHAWTGGALGLMTLAVMSRATLGHTGRALVASRATQAIFAFALVSVLARMCASLRPAWFAALLTLAAGAWIAAYLGFAIVYWNALTRPRLR